jgi:hypothetical protein
LSASGQVNNLGTLPVTNGSTNNASVIQWNGLFTGLYAYPTPSASAGWVTIVSQ